MKRAVKFLKWTFAIFAALLIMLAAYEAISAWSVSRSYPPPGERVAIGSATIHLNCQGPRGTGPTTILESGGGDISLAWRKVQPILAASHRVCAYDRAGQGWSSSSDTPRRPDAIATELRSALSRAKENGPFILVGHSRGGIFARAFASKYPQSIAGMVLIDSSVNDVPGAPPPLALEKGQLGLLKLACHGARFGLVRLLRPGHATGDEAEKIAFALQSRREAVCANYHEFAEIDAGHSGPAIEPLLLGTKPVIVLTSTGPLKGINALDRDQQREVETFRRAYQKTQAAFLRLSRCSIQQFARESGHAVQLDQPEAVISAVQDIYERKPGSCDLIA